MSNWLTAQELAGLPGMPTTDRGCKLMASRESWWSRRRAGSKAREYPVRVLPSKTRQALSEPPARKDNSSSATEVASRIRCLELLLQSMGKELVELKHEVLRGNHA
jgi:hypothetical protein